MSIEKSKSHFSGKAGEKLNCAQSILTAFKDTFALPDQLIARFKAYGGGKAPGGLCGAFYAAKVIVEKHSPGKLKDLETAFRAAAGSTACEEIRSSRKLSCLGCIEKAAEFLEQM